MKTVGFGDFLIHFSPIGDERFAQSEYMQMSFTGAEANVCAALSYWGEQTKFVTRLPEHALAKKGVSFLRSFGIDTENISYGDGRMGVYYLENGRFLRSSSVIYDRDGSVFTASGYDDYDWDAIFNDADVFYVSGITPALSESLFETVKRAMAEAKSRSIRVFFDINYRPKLATPIEYYDIIKELLPYISYLIGNEEHLKMIFGISSEYGENEPERRLSDIIAKVREKTEIEHIAVTVRRTISASEALVYAAFSSGKDFAISPQIRTGVVDRVGSGDAFSAGLIYATVNGYCIDKAIRFASASGALKHTVTKDINFASVEEIQDIMNQAVNDVRR
ncbi:MAG: sugar kinase [Clostridia bacterium]|nr:sugar kinase [Clostridia bacterium]